MSVSESAVMAQEADARALSVSHAAIALAGPHNGAALWGSGCAAVLQPSGMLSAVRLGGRGQSCDVAQYSPNCVFRALPAGATGMALEALFHVRRFARQVMLLLPGQVTSGLQVA